MIKKSISLFLTCLVVVTLISVSAFADSKKGEEIYSSKKIGNCKTCHKLSSKKKVGPGLKGMFNRYSEGWIKIWLKDPQGTWERNNPETQKMKKMLRKERKSKTMMKLPKGGLSDEQINDLIDYLKEATK